jgi:hypothetical protein
VPTNFYLRPTGACESQCSNWVHLGKSSIGWTFTFRAYPDPDTAPPAVTWPVTDFASWRQLLDLGGVFDEYGRHVVLADLLALIETQRGGLDDTYGSDFRDEAGNRFVPVEFS